MRRSDGTRSGLETKVIKDMQKRGISFKYEPFKLEYSTTHTYLPDIELVNGLIVEIKGYFDAATRSKMVAIKKIHKDRVFALLFQDASKKIRKGSDTTYGQWATKNGFIWAEGVIPAEWVSDVEKKIGVK